MSEPAFIVQTRQPVELHREWIERQCRRAADEGCSFARCTTHPDDEQTILIEAWRGCQLDQGEPRWINPDPEESDNA